MRQIVQVARIRYFAIGVVEVAMGISVLSSVGVEIFDGSPTIDSPRFVLERICGFKGKSGVEKLVVTLTVRDLIQGIEWCTSGMSNSVRVLDDVKHASNGSTSNIHGAELGVLGEHVAH